MRWLHRPWVGPAVAILSLLAFGVAISAYKISLIRHIQFIGHGDEAGYVAMGQSLAEGRGLDVDYVSYFYISYPREITHREDHWPPFMGFAIAPFFWLFGTQPWAAKLAPIFIGSIGLPLATAALALAYSRRAYVALIAGLLMLFNSSLFTDSLRTFSDEAMTMLVMGFCAAMIAARRHPRLHLLAGLFIGLTYYSKGLGLVLFGVYPLAAALAAGPQVFRARWLWLGMLTAALCFAPWFISNCRNYGNPLHSTQNYVSGFYGLQDWEVGAYTPYWGKDLPRTSDRWTKYGDRYWPLVAANTEKCVRYALLGPSTHPGEWHRLGLPVAELGQGVGLGEESAEPATPATTSGKSIGKLREPLHVLSSLLAVGLVAVLMVVALSRRLIQLLRGRTGPAPSGGDELFPSLLGSTLSLLLVMASLAAFLIFLWEVYRRFTFVFLPPIAVMGCTAGSLLIEWPLALKWPRFIERWQGIITVATAVVLLVAGACLAGRFTAYHARRMPQAYPYRDEPFYPAMGDWIKSHLPNAVIMSRNCWELRFYCAGTSKTVNIPNATDTEIFRIARYYRVTHYLADGLRPALDPYVKQIRPGLRPVEGVPGPLFELDYAKLP